MGCWFHYIKCLYHNLKIRGIYLKRYKKVNSRLIYLLKFFPYIDHSFRSSFSKSFKLNFFGYFSALQIDSIHTKKFVSFFNYFDKNWLNYEQSVKCDEESYSFLFSRTNNPCENFHRCLNHYITIYKN